MQPLFAGTTKKRDINLSGSSRTQAHDLALETKRQRIEREQLRQRQSAAQRLQSTWRGRSGRAGIRQAWAEEFDAAYASVGGSGSGDLTSTARSLLRLTSLLIHSAKGREAATVTAQRASKWCRAVVSPIAPGANDRLLFAPFNLAAEETSRWGHLLYGVASLLLRLISIHAE